MVEPGGFEMREVGVILQVVPEVSADGQMIDLMLNPQIISEPSWRDYGFDYQLPDTEPIHVRMEQPFFQVRSISTSISIYNGATVVMGGMITESRTEVDDKIPLLGDVPLLGRLFRSRYEQSEKRNLLIFVTARLVDPAGRSLKTQVDVAPTAVDTATAEIAPDKP
jgi:general secretion pathway protein D